MSRPHFYWYGIVKKMVSKYPELRNSAQESLYRTAIEESLEQTKQSLYGAEKADVIERYIKGESLDEVAARTYHSRRTVQRWVSEFITIVGRKVGF